jgi:predicted transcriptional regulator
MAEEVLSSFCMRATITVDSELAERIERLSQERATSFENLANAALREGLEQLARGTPGVGAGPEKKSGRISYTHPVSLGDCLLESLDDLSSVLAAAEGERFK